jgi:lipopolysaccharide export system permease protein
VKILDRLIIQAYIRSYLICLFTLLSLYIVVDLCTNLDKFFGGDQGILRGFQAVGTYYTYRSSQIFDRMCEPIVLAAAMFTVAWMQRNNELMPLLSAGVPTRRILWPVLIGAMFLLAIGVANQELVIPRIAHVLTRDQSDFEGRKDQSVQATYDSTGIHIEGGQGHRQGMVVTDFHCTIPDRQGNGLAHLSAREARYVPPGTNRFTGGWLLTDTVPAELPDWDNPKLAGMVDKGKWFLYTRNTDFAALTRNATWYMYFSTRRLHDLLHDSDSRRMGPMAVLFHMRLTRPLVGMLLVVMGLAVILRDPNRHVFISSGYCLVLTAIFFAAVYGFKFLGDQDLIAPALAAWSPVLIFGPIAFVMFDSMHT